MSAEHGEKPGDKTRPGGSFQKDNNALPQGAPDSGNGLQRDGRKQPFRAIDPTGKDTPKEHRKSIDGAANNGTRGPVEPVNLELPQGESTRDGIGHGGTEDSLPEAEGPTETRGIWPSSVSDMDTLQLEEEILGDENSALSIVKKLEVARHRNAQATDLCEILNTAITTLFDKNQTTGTRKDVTFSADTGETARMISYESIDGRTTIFLGTTPEPQAQARYSIFGQEHWTKELSKNGIASPAILGIATKQHLTEPATSVSGDSNETEAVVVLQFFIPGGEDKNIHWNQVVSQVVNSDGNPSEAGFEALLSPFMSTKNMDSIESSSGVGMDILYERAAINSTRQQMEYSIYGKKIVAETASGSEESGAIFDFTSLEADLQTSETETMRRHFAELDVLEKGEEVRTGEGKDAEVDRECILLEEAFGPMAMDTAAEEARQLVSKVLEKEGSRLTLDDANKSSEVLADLAKIAAKKGNLPVVQKYCELLEAMPGAQPSAKAVAYFAADRLGDEAGREMWQKILMEEFEERIGDIPIINDGRALHAMVTEFAEHGVSVDTLVDTYAMKRDNEGEIVPDQERIWLLFKQYANVTGDQEDLDRIAKALDTDMGLPPEFVLDNVFAAFSDCKDVDLRSLLVRRALHASDAIPSNYKNLRILVQLGGEVLKDPELYEEMDDPNAPLKISLIRRIDQTIINHINKIHSELESNKIVSPDPKDEAKQAYKIWTSRLEAHTGFPSEGILHELDILKETRIDDTVGMAPGKAESRIKHAEAQHDELLSQTATQYFLDGNPATSQMFLEKMTTDQRANAYVDCWSLAKTSEQVQQLVPAEMQMSGDPLLDVIPSLPILYETAVATTSENIDILTQRAREVVGFITQPSHEENRGNDWHITGTLHSQQFRILMEKLQTKDWHTAQVLAKEFLPKFDSATHVSRDLTEGLYPILDRMAVQDLDTEGQELVVNSIRMRNASAIDRAFAFAHYALQLTDSLLGK